jgi:hypothetical protein
VTTAAQARAARRTVERALDASGWKWDARLSRWIDWIDMLLLLEEGA